MQSIKKCRREGCDNPMQARGLCNKHYKAFCITRMKETGKPLGRSGNNSHDVLADLMPATAAELVTATGMKLNTVACAVRTMRKLDPQLAHIGQWQPPQKGVQGSRWVPVFYAGPGKDAKLTAKMRKDHTREYARRWHAVNSNKPRLHGMEALLFKRISHQSTQGAKS